MSLEVQTRPGIDDYSGLPLGGTQATGLAPTGVGIMPPERNDSGLHSCQDCNAQFTRLEHLKRHATSLHGSLSAKPHRCQFCGRRFSRRDVLLRHYQSCRAAKAASHLAEPASARDKRASQICENCGESKLGSGGGSALENSGELVHQCTAAPRQKPSPNRRKESQAVSSFWPVPEDESAPVNADEARQVSSASFSDTIHVSSQRPHSINLPPRRTDSEVGHSLTQNGNGFESIHQEDTDVHADDRSLGESQRSSYFRPDTLTRRVTDVGKRIADPPCPRSTSDEPSSPKGRRAANKRGRYVSNACKNCQKRKVKCSGEEICLQCRSAGLACAYNHGRKRRNTTSLVEDRPRPPPAETQPTIPLPGGETNLSESLSQMMARIASLERDCNTFKNLAAITASNPSNIDAAENFSDYETSSQSETNSQSNSSIASLPHTSIFRGATSLLNPIEALNHIVSGEGQAQTDSGIETQPSQNQPSPREYRLLPPRSGSKDIRTIEKETRLEDQAFLRYAVDVYFSTLNPHYPSLNENYIRARLERFLANDSNQIGSGDWYQFVALLNLMKAEVKLMTYDWPEHADAPAWEDFCAAETILNHLIWLGNGNVWTIQCLLIKARYLFYSERADSAYDTMGQIVRLCFLVGLHNQSSWKGCGPFETVMRQRLFWTIFYLERNVALNVGAPYLIRESDVKVDLPKNYDDKCLFPNRPLPDETPERSPGPYQIFTAKWGRLVAEIWDTIFGINAQKPTSQEFLASMDARISYTISQFPEHLQLHRNMYRLDGSSDAPNYILRQTAILHYVSLTYLPFIRTWY